MHSIKHDQVLHIIYLKVSVSPFIDFYQLYHSACANPWSAKCFTFCRSASLLSITGTILYNWCPCVQCGECKVSKLGVNERSYLAPAEPAEPHHHQTVFSSSNLQNIQLGLENFNKHYLNYNLALPWGRALRRGSENILNPFNLIYPVIYLEI